MLNKMYCLLHFFIYHFGMSEIIGYMATWNTYGSWLPGDERGYVNNQGQTVNGNEGILQISTERQKYPTVKLNKQERKTAEQIILAEAEKIGHEIIALAVCTNHVHLLAKPHQQPIDKIIGRYKSITTRAFWGYGRKGEIWARGFDKQYCYTVNELTAKINYVQKHNAPQSGVFPQHRSGG
jgi:REP element-mobilizing transposase RayT